MTPLAVQHQYLFDIYKTIKSYMSYTFLITAFFIIWSLFGLCVLFNLEAGSKPSLRLAIVIGPIIMIFGLVIIGFLLLIEKTTEWTK
jgi:hypothetical protein